MGTNPTIHATAVLAGRFGLLIRGPSGSGKSRLAYQIISNPAQFGVPFGRLIADDRVFLCPQGQRLSACPPENLAGKIELRGFGILHVPHEAEALIDLVIDLDCPDAERLPEKTKLSVTLEGLKLPVARVSRGQSLVLLVREGLLGLLNL